MYLNDKPKERIRKSGLKQRFLADKLGIDEGAFASILLGRRSAPEDFVERLAYELNFAIEEIVREEKRMAVNA